VCAAGILLASDSQRRLGNEPPFFFGYTVLTPYDLPNRPGQDQLIPIRAAHTLAA